MQIVFKSKLDSGNIDLLGDKIFPLVANLLNWDYNPQIMCDDWSVIIEFQNEHDISSIVQIFSDGNLDIKEWEVTIVR